MIKIYKNGFEKRYFKLFYHSYTDGAAEVQLGVAEVQLGAAEVQLGAAEVQLGAAASAGV